MSHVVIEEAFKIWSTDNTLNRAWTEDLDILPAHRVNMSPGALSQDREVEVSSNRLPLVFDIDWVSGRCNVTDSL